MSEVEFDELTHTYLVAGVVVPGVTQILSDLSIFKRLDPAMVAAASERGKLVHEAVHLDNIDDLDENTVHESIEPYLRAWRRFRADRKFNPLHAETIIYSEKWNYAGTFDALGTWKVGRREVPVIVDVKTGLKDPCHGPQLAAYLEPARAMGMIDGTRNVPHRVVARLQATGFYEVDDYMDPMDLSIFMGALVCYNFKARNGLL